MTPHAKTSILTLAAACGFAPLAFAQDAAPLTVGYFLEWPMPFQFAKANGTYDEALGRPVNWVAFDTGPAMSAAMASGDVQISVSQGVPPFVIAASAGQDLQVIDVAVSYADNENCVVSSALEIDKDNAADLAGKTAAVPLGTAAHYGFLTQMAHFGVDPDSLTVIDMAPPEGAAALSQGAVDMMCGYGGPLRTALDYGNVLLTGAEKEALGMLVFDVTSAPGAFVAENPDLVATFLKVTADANALWNAGTETDAMLEVIAQDSGMTLDLTREFMANFSFPDIDAQVSEAWLGGAAANQMAGVAQVLVESGAIPAALDDYGPSVNLEPLQAAAEM